MNVSIWGCRRSVFAMTTSAELLNECACMMYVLLLCYQPRIEYRSAIAEATKALIGPAVRWTITLSLFICHISSGFCVPEIIKIGSLVSDIFTRKYRNWCLCPIVYTFYRSIQFCLSINDFVQYPMLTILHASFVEYSYRPFLIQPALSACLSLYHYVYLYYLLLL